MIQFDLCLNVPLSLSPPKSAVVAVVLAGECPLSSVVPWIVWRMTDGIPRWAQRIAADCQDCPLLLQAASRTAQVAFTAGEGRTPISAVLRNLFFAEEIPSRQPTPDTAPEQTPETAGSPGAAVPPPYLSTVLEALGGRPVAPALPRGQEAGHWAYPFRLLMKKDEQRGECCHNGHSAEAQMAA